MEDESSLRLIVSDNPPTSHGGSSSSQASPPLSSLPSTSLPPLQVSTQELFWSNAEVRFLLSQFKEHVEAHNTVMMRNHQWVRIHKLFIAQFPHEYSGRNVKSLSDKWERLQSTYLKMKKLCGNQTGAGVRDNGAKFIWYNDIDEILSLAGEANGILGGMNQGTPMQGTGTLNAPVDLIEELDGGGQPSPLQPPLCSILRPSLTTNDESSGSNVRGEATDLVGCCDEGTSSKPTKRAKIDRSVMDAFNRLVDSTTKIEKLGIEASMTMHRDNLIERRENRKLELKLFQLQLASHEHMVALFANVIKKSAK